MRRTVGNILFYLGGLIVLVACFLRSPSFWILNGHYVKTWVAEAVIGFVLVLCGIFVAGPSRKR